MRLVPPKYLVPEDAYDVRPSYYIHAGLLFAPLSRDYLKTWGEDWPSEAPGDLISIYESGVRSPERRQVAVLQKVLADRSTQGYHDVGSVIVDQVDGHKVRDMKHLIKLIERGRGEFLRITTGGGYRIVLDRAEVKKRSAGILRRYNVPFDRSEDLR